MARHHGQQAWPRIISDNGPQFIAKDFKEFIRILWYDARPNRAVLPAIERQDRTLAKSLKGSLSGQQWRYRSMIHGVW